jgi:hypothetical protein
MAAIGPRCRYPLTKHNLGQHRSHLKKTWISLRDFKSKPPLTRSKCPKQSFRFKPMTSRAAKKPARTPDSFSPLLFPRRMTHRIVMPIRPSQRWFYPIDWRELSQVIRFSRARGRCEHCRRPHLQLVIVGPDGLWWDEARQSWRDHRGRRSRALSSPIRLAALQPVLAGIAALPLPSTYVVLATAHLDQNPGNNADNNLAALCQRCHLTHDRAAHRRQRWMTLFYARALGDLFSGLYPEPK